MTENQRIVKNIAKLLAGIIIVLIIIGVISFVIGVFNFILSFSDPESSDEFKTVFETDKTAIKSMSIDINAASLSIKVADSLHAESNSNRITVKENGDTLCISEKKSSWFVNSDSIQVVLYIPSDIIFDEIELDTGAASVDIDFLNTKNIDMELGAGKVIIDTLISTNHTSIEGGAGNFTIFGGTIHNLDMDWGVGNAEITAEILGDSDIDSGVGNLELNLTGEAEIYKIFADKGIGNFIIDGKSVSDGHTVGNGNNTIYIDSGVGNTTVRFSK